jgi:hypothetical protein
MEPGKILVRQLIVTLYCYPYIKYDVRFRDVELWNDDLDFHLYEEGEEIFIEKDADRYFCEIFIDVKTPYNKLIEIYNTVKDEMIKHFEKKINNFTDYIIEINKHTMTM